MINIAGKEIDPKTISGQYPPNGAEARIIEELAKSGEAYSYDSEGQLKFELKLRKGIVDASKDLNHSGLAFKTFRKSKCNPEFWQRTNEGGFQLQSGVKPSDAIRDIYDNGSQYGTECSTAMVIVYFKALLDVLPEELFNKLFSDIYLMNWQHLDPDLGIVTVNKPKDYLPGDGRYFDNPDVDPLTPEWQGENAFDLGGGQFYGHGIGVTSADRIIEGLNSARIEGSDKTAYLMETAERPNFRSLYKKYLDYNTAGGTAQSTFSSSFWQAWNRSEI